jgi:peptidyl-dipeptidase A
MDATAIVDYFAPLKTWLDEQNRGQTVGWEQALVRSARRPPGAR